MPRTLTGNPNGVSGRIAVIVSRYNATVTDRLLAGALTTLQSCGVPDESIEIVRVPGAWELSLAASALAKRGDCAAIVCLGAVIKGETTHDEHINRQVSESLGRLGLEYQLPIGFGLLTCQNLEQALNRAGGAVGNKGEEATLAALEMAGLLREIRSQPS